VSGIRCKTGQMPNVAAILKSEISRVARKEVRAETESLNTAVARGVGRK